MPLPPSLERAARESEEALSRMMDAYDRQLFATIQDIEREILRLLRELELGPSGNILKTSANLQRAINAWYAATRFAQQEIAELTDRWTSQFLPVTQFLQDNLNKSGLAITIDAVDERLIAVMREMATIDLNSGVNFVYRDLGRELMSQTLVGGNFNELVRTIQAKLSSDLLAGTIEVAAGQSLANIATRIGHDSLLTMYRTLHLKKANDAEVQRFLYFGSLVKDSRDFCIARAGKVFTRQEIESWNNLQWRGKIAGTNVFTTLGGFNCRHHLVAIPNSVSEADLGLEVAA